MILPCDAAIVCPQYNPYSERAIAWSR